MWFDLKYNLWRLWKWNDTNIFLRYWNFYDIRILQECFNNLKLIDWTSKVQIELVKCRYDAETCLLNYSGAVKNSSRAFKESSGKALNEHWLVWCSTYCFYVRGCQTSQFTPDKPGRFTFPMVFWRSYSVQNNVVFIMGCIESSPWVWIWTYCYLKWSAWIWSFHSFMHNILSVQNFRRCICKIQCKPVENLMKI